MFRTGAPRTSTIDCGDPLADAFYEALAIQPEPRTEAATRARKTKHARRLALELGPRAEYLPDDVLSTLAGVLRAACLERGVPVADLR